MNFEQLRTRRGIFLLLIYLQIPTLLFLFGFLAWLHHGFKLDLATNDLYKNHVIYNSQATSSQLPELLKSPLAALHGFPPVQSIRWGNSECFLWRANPAPIYRCAGSQDEVYISSSFLSPDREPFYTELFDKTLFRELETLKSRDCTISDLWTLQNSDEFQRSHPKCYAAWKLVKQTFHEQKISISLDDEHQSGLIQLTSQPDTYKLVVHEKYTELFLNQASTSHN